MVFALLRAKKIVMKKFIPMIMLSAAFIISSCKKKEQDIAETPTENKAPEKFVIDSVKISDSVVINEMASAKYESKALVFPSIKNKALLDSIYYNKRTLADFSKQGLQKFLENDKKEYFTSVKDRSLDWSSDMRRQDWESGTSMKLISHKDDFLQIEYLFTSYQGGAHGNYAFSDRVFDLKNNKKVDLKDITTMPKARLEALLKKNIDKLPSGTTSAQGSVRNSDMLLVDVIPANDNFYFDDKNLYFHYSPYDIAAYAAGDIVIPVSWDELKGTLNPQFKERMKIN